MSHCCRERHYFIDIKKCGDSTCTIYKPIRLPDEVFSKLTHMPDPMPGSDGQYKPFSDVAGTETTEEHRPSLQKFSQKEKHLPFYPSVQHTKNANVLLQCEECGMWRLVYAKRKLKPAERQALQTTLDGLSFSCGSQLQDADDLRPSLKDIICVKKLHSNDPVEKLYYSANLEDICIHCAKDVPSSSQRAHYPQCEDCCRQCAKIDTPNARESLRFSP